MKKRDFIKEAGDRAVIWVTPANVTRHFGTKWPVGKARFKKLRRFLPRAVVNLLRKRIKRAEPFTIPAEHFAGKPAVTETHRYRLLEDLAAHSDDLRASLWFRTFQADLAAKGVADYKGRKLHSEDEILEFLDSYVLGLIESIRATGFDASKTGYESSAVIDAEGRLMKTSSGNHRFCIATLLDLPLFPLMIVGAHEDWVRQHISGPVTVEKVLSQLPAIERAHRRPCSDVSDLEREDDPEGGAFARGALDAQTPAVAVDDVLDDGEAKPGTAHFA